MSSIKARFYVGHPKMARVNSWAHPTLKDAVEHAKQQVEKTGDVQVVVQIVRVVQREEPPITVETV